MIRFAALLDQLAYEPGRNAKIAILRAYFSDIPDPDRGYALAALTGGLDFAHAKPALIRGLIAERCDPVLFDLSYDYVGDLSETVALLWPGSGPSDQVPGLTEVVDHLATAGKTDMPGLVAGWLDRLDEAGRWAFLKLITGGLRVGVSARLAKTAIAGLGTQSVNDVEEIWHGQEPPYEALFAWLEGRAARPAATDPTPFRPPMLSHAVADEDFAKLDPADFLAEWKWDGIRVQAAAASRADGTRQARLYSRSGDDISKAFPDLIEAIDFDGAIDGELLIVVDGRVQPFHVLQQRLNRKTVSAKMLAQAPAHIRAYDLLQEGEEDLRPLPFAERRQRLERFVAATASDRLDLSPLVRFDSWDDLARQRADPAAAGAGEDGAAVEGCMIKRADSPYLAGRPRGHWFKWKRDPFIIDAVLLYAQRGHGKRSSFYSDYTFGVWRDGEGGPELVPVGKAYFGFTDAELREIDRFVRANTVNRFGPVREVTHGLETGLVLEVAFEGLNRSKRHKSGLAMRFPRISRLRWDKRPAEADTIDVLEALLPQ